MTHLQNEPGESGNSDATAATEGPAGVEPPPSLGGPRTPWGKARSSQNAVKHGLCAQAAIIEGEDPVELEAMHAEFLNDERPQTATERLLVERIVMAGWRLRRAGRYEAHLVTANLAIVRRQRVQNGKWKRDKDTQAEAELDRPRAIHLMLAGRAHAQMVRHETALGRELYKAIGELRKVLADRTASSRHGRRGDPDTQRTVPETAGVDAEVPRPQPPPRVG